MSELLRVSYLELTRAPAPAPAHTGPECIACEKLAVEEYLDLYQRIGAQVRWDQRLQMPRAALIELLQSARDQLYVLRDERRQILGFCEFERVGEEAELKNFGLIAAAQGRGLGTWLLRTALHHEWSQRPARIWLHTDNWDHGAALHMYQSAGFRIYQLCDEPPGEL
ncbi:MAG: GNAT family N-acetyltransferase [Sinobacteraceae bacterium]|nr:GNAT family N-acetyltransferase [Nevskiaceae bacterium]MBV9914706.1 GNAT family N-acetyltransferase [Nevskiaceae bacterium]